MFKKQKKEKSTIKKFFPSLPVEVLALQEIFEKMSERGYLVIGNSNSFYEFEECEPKKRKFHVEYFIKASVFDSRPEKKTIEFIDFCEVAGWNYCFSNGKMQCFYTEDVDSPDIETDDQLRFQSIIKADIYSQITVWLLSVLYLLVGIKEGISTFQHYHPFSEFTTSSIQFGLVSFFLVYIVMSLTSFIDFMVFYMRNNKNVSIGEPLKLYSPKKTKARMIRRFIILAVTIVGIILISFYEIYIAIIMVMFIVTILVILLSHARFGKSKLSNRSTNIVMTILIAFATMQVFTLMVIGSSNVIQVTVVGNYLNSVYQQDELPLALEELGIYKSDEYPRRGSYLNISETFIAKKVFFSDSFGSSDGYYKNLDSGVLYPFIRVSVFESNYAWVVNKYRELYFSDREEFNISPMDYSTLYEQGYDGYIAEVKGRFELMLVIDMKSIHIVSHEKLTEENILLILSSI